MINKINKMQKKRLKVCIVVDLFLAGVTIFAMKLGMDGVATTAITGILSTSSLFIVGDSLRKSDPA